MKKEKKLLILGVLLCFAFAIWTVLIQTADVKPAGQNGTYIGFASFNLWFFKLCGVHMMLYIITDWLGLAAIAVCMIFGALGFVQMIKRKSLLKVDYDIRLLGIYYIIVIFCYLIFEMIPINYRPILFDGRMEVSYPSSTTLLVLSVMPTLVFQANRRLKNICKKRAVVGFSVLFSAFMVTGRLVCGVHWFTDIFAGILLSGGLFTIYMSLVLLNDKK